LKEDLKSYKGKQLKKGESFVVFQMTSSGNAWIKHPEFGDDCIGQEDFGRLEVTVVVALPSVPCQWNPMHSIVY